MKPGAKIAYTADFCISMGTADHAKYAARRGTFLAWPEKGSRLAHVKWDDISVNSHVNIETITKHGSTEFREPSLKAAITHGICPCVPDGVTERR